MVVVEAVVASANIIGWTGIEEARVHICADVVNGGETSWKGETKAESKFLGVGREVGRAR